MLIQIRIRDFNDLHTFFDGKLPWIAKKLPKFYDLKKSVRKHFKEAVETLKSKIDQFMPSCSNNKLQKHKRATHPTYIPSRGNFIEG